MPMQIKHPRALAASVALLSVAGWNLATNNSNHDNTANGGAKITSLKSPAKKAKQTESFFEETTIQKYYPGLSQRYKENLFNMLIECEAKCPDLMQPLLDALKDGVSPRTFELTSNEELRGSGIRMLPRFNYAAEFAVKITELIKEKNPANIKQEILIDRLSHETGVQALPQGTEILDAVRSKKTPNEPLLHALNSEDPQINQLFIQPTKDLINSLGVFTPSEAQNLESFIFGGADLGIPLDSTKLAAFLENQANHPEKLAELKSVLAKVSDLREANQIAITSAITQASSVSAANNVLGLLEQGKISSQELIEFTKLHGMFELPPGTGSMIDFLGKQQETGIQQIRDFLALRRENHSRIQRSSLDMNMETLERFDNMNPNITAAVLDRIPEISQPESTITLDKLIEEEVSRFINEK